MDLTKTPIEIYRGSPESALHQPSAIDVVKLEEEQNAAIEGLEAVAGSAAQGVADLSGRMAAVEGIATSGAVPKASVSTVALTNITLSGVQTVSGLASDSADALAKGVLVVGQSAPAQNGVWIPGAGAWTRRADLDAAAEFAKVSVRVDGGTYAGRTYWQTATITTLGTDAVVWSMIADDGGLVSDLSGSVNELAHSLGPANFSETYVDESVFSIEGEAGGPSFVDINADGNPTLQAAERIADAIEPFIDASLAGVTGLPLPEGTSNSFVVVDENENKSHLSLDENGKFETWVLDDIKDHVLADLEIPDGSDTIDLPPEFFLTVGDSLSAGATASGESTRWRNVLSVMTGVPAVPMAVGGETARTIIARIGVLPFMVNPVGGEIPASGAVEVSVTGYDGNTANPLIQGNAGVNPVKWNGVTGNFTRNSGTGVYSFTRSEAGDAVPVPFATPMIPNAYTAYRKGMGIWWLGQNGGFVDDADLVRMVRQGVDWQIDPRFLVMTAPSSTAAARAGLEGAFLREFGVNYVNIRAYLSSLWALELCGITPTTGDTDAIAVGSVPPSFLSDSVHHNDNGQFVIATVLYLRGKDLGYWS